MQKKTFGLKKNFFHKNKKKHQKNRYGKKGKYKGGRQNLKKSNLNTLQRPELVWQKYDNLLERHLASRQKYYNYFHRVDIHRRKKLEQNFYSSLQQLRKFESSLNYQQKKWLEKKTNGLKADHLYSNNHNLSSSEHITDPEEAEPHFLPSQKESDFSQDKETSSGTMEDYRKLKTGTFNPLQ